MRRRARRAAGRSVVGRERHVGVHEERSSAPRARARGAGSTRSPCRCAACSSAVTASGPSRGGGAAGVRVERRSRAASTPRAAANARSVAQRARRRRARRSGRRAARARAPPAGPACQLAHACSSVRPSAGSSVRHGTASVTTALAHAGRAQAGAHDAPVGRGRRGAAERGPRARPSAPNLHDRRRRGTGARRRRGRGARRSAARPSRPRPRGRGRSAAPRSRSRRGRRARAGTCSVRAPSRGRAGAEVHVLAVEEVARVEAAELPEEIARAPP